MLSVRVSFEKNENQIKFLGVFILLLKILHHQHIATLCLVKTSKFWIGAGCVCIFSLIRHKVRGEHGGYTLQNYTLSSQRISVERHF